MRAAARLPRIVAPCLALSVLAAAGTARAQGLWEDADRDRFRPSYALHVDAGVVSALGEFGGDAQYQPVEHFLIELGVGYGWSGVQLSVMPKLVFGSAHHRFVTGIGLSVGVPGVKFVTNNGPSGGNVDERSVTPWFNLDAVGYEYRSRGGFSFTIAGGLGVGLMDGGCVAGVDGCLHVDQPFPQLRIGLGSWFS